MKKTITRRPPRSHSRRFSSVAAALVVLAAACAAPRPAAPPPSAGEVLSALEQRRGLIQTLSLEGRGKLANKSRRTLRGDVFLYAAKPDCLRLEAYGPFGQPVLFVAMRGLEAQAISFLERRYYTGRADSPRMAAFLPLGLTATELISLLSATPLPTQTCHGVPLGQDPALQLAAEGRGSALLVCEGASGGRLLFDADLDLIAGSVRLGGSDLTALYSDWKQVDSARFPFTLEFSLPGQERALKLELSKARLNEPLDPSLFSLSPPPGFAVERAG
ncbi:MAG: DUF4292 domain-containing protein [Pseudomonadota bacterium]